MAYFFIIVIVQGTGQDEPKQSTSIQSCLAKKTELSLPADRIFEFRTCNSLSDLSETQSLHIEPLSEKNYIQEGDDKDDTEKEYTELTPVAARGKSYIGIKNIFLIIFFLSTSKCS